MNNLIESIINKDYVAADMQLHEKLEYIREKKLYEEKRIIAALHEVVKPVRGKPGQFRGSNTKADWAKYRKQHKRIKWDQNKEGEKVAEKPKATPLGKGGKLSAGDIKARRKAGYLQAHPALKSLEFIKKVTQYHKTGKINEQTEMERKLAAASAEQQAAADAEKAARQKAKDRGAFGMGKQDQEPKDQKQEPKGRAEPKTASGRRFAAMRDLVRKKRDQEAQSYAQRAQQRHIDRNAGRALRDVVKGKDIRKNASTLIKTAGQTTIGKKVKPVGQWLKNDILGSIGEGKE